MCKVDDNFKKTFLQPRLRTVLLLDEHGVIDYQALLISGPLSHVDVRLIEYLKLGDAVVGDSLGAPRLRLADKGVDQLGAALI